jgi:hypothetical protein
MCGGIRWNPRRDDGERREKLGIDGVLAVHLSPLRELQLFSLFLER